MSEPANPLTIRASERGIVRVFAMGHASRASPVSERPSRARADIRRAGH